MNSRPQLLAAFVLAILASGCISSPMKESVNRTGTDKNKNPVTGEEKFLDEVKEISSEINRDDREVELVARRTYSPGSGGNLGNEEYHVYLGNGSVLNFSSTVQPGNSYAYEDEGFHSTRRLVDDNGSLRSTFEKNHSYSSSTEYEIYEIPKGLCLSKNRTDSTERNKVLNYTAC